MGQEIRTDLNEGKDDSKGFESIKTVPIQIKIDTEDSILGGSNYTTTVENSDLKASSASGFGRVETTETGIQTDEMAGNLKCGGRTEDDNFVGEEDDEIGQELLPCGGDGGARRRMPKSFSESNLKRILQFSVSMDRLDTNDVLTISFEGDIVNIQSSSRCDTSDI